ncbi:hypothetical protein [Roseospira marina]|nr:hypothetical protein [Roseospira marina]MBB4316056.1 hypothetical protein [Roseospira marina]MBB5089226.1 hypothetical protein [Roseospira marina]
MSRPTYAHVEGTGPAGEYCQSCAHWTRSAKNPAPFRRAAMVCAVVARQTGLPLDRLGTVYSHRPACRHWQRKGTGS